MPDSFTTKIVDMLVQHRALRVAVYDHLILSLGWRFVHLDDAYAILMPQRPDTAALLQREGYRHILPWFNMVVTPTNAPAALWEADRALQHCPQKTTFAHAYRAEALRLMGRYEESQTAKLQIPKQLIIE